MARNIAISCWKKVSPKKSPTLSIFSNFVTTRATFDDMKALVALLLLAFSAANAQTISSLVSNGTTVSWGSSTT